MKTRKVSISVFQILISIIVIIAIVLGIIAVKNVVTKKQNANKEKTTFEGSGTSEDAYQISKVEDLINLLLDINKGRTYDGKHFVLQTNLNLQEDSSYNNPNDKSFGDLNNDGEAEEIKKELTTGDGLRLIGKKDLNSKKDREVIFKGIFDGNGKTISNLEIKISDDNTNQNIGLFGENKGTILNLRIIEKLEITNIEKSNLNIGLLAGKNSGIIQKCKTEGEIKLVTEKETETLVAGLAGENVGKIIDSVNEVNIESNCTKAGITAKNTKIEGTEDSGVITNCTSNGIISEEKSYNKYTAGIVALNEKGTITNCTNNGKISGKKVGGIIGSSTGDVIASKNTGELNNITENLDNNEIAGGIVATLESGTIENCKNTGKVTGVTYIGGITGQNKGVITQSRNDGELKKIDQTSVGNVYLGGITGYNYSGSRISNSKNYGNIKSDQDNLVIVGGVCGYLENNSFIDYCENNSFITAVGKIITPNEDTSLKCTSCVSNGGGKAGTSESGELYIGLIYGKCPIESEEE